MYAQNIILRCSFCFSYLATQKIYGKVHWAYINTSICVMFLYSLGSKRSVLQASSLVMRAETYIGFHINYSLLQTDFNQNLFVSSFSQKITIFCSAKPYNLICLTKISEEPGDCHFRIGGIFTLKQIVGIKVHAVISQKVL